MQVFVSGVWKDEKALKFGTLGVHLGEMIARAGYDLACGPGTGIARYVIDGYRAIEPRGRVRFYLPKLEEMAKIGEEVGPGADEIIQTEYDYPLRNIYQVKCSDALIILSGGDGSLEEAIAALAEYQIPVVALKGSGTAALALEKLVEIYPSWSDHLVIDTSIDVLFESLRTRIASRK